MSEEQHAAWRYEINCLMDNLNLDEMRVLGQVARGLFSGRKVYGPLDTATETRDMIKETLEEVRDALVYVGTKLVQLQGT